MLALELEQLLKKRGEVEAAQVPQAKVVDRCLDLDAAEGMLVLDLVAGTIAHVEVLNRCEIRQKLIAEFP